MQYTPVILDHSYLKNSFLQNAKMTISLSGGTRSYKRTHYIYAARKISNYSGIVITGIFGDEVLKTGRPSGGDVLSANTIDFIRSDFDVKKVLMKIKSNPESSN